MANSRVAARLGQRRNHVARKPNGLLPRMLRESQPLLSRIGGIQPSIKLGQCQEQQRDRPALSQGVNGASHDDGHGNHVKHLGKRDRTGERRL